MNERQSLKYKPEGSITFAVREAMKITNNNPAGARKAKLAQQTYAFVRRLVILSEAEDHVPSDDRSIMRSALRKIDEEKSIVTARKATKEIVEKYWVAHTMNGLGTKVKLKSYQEATEKQHQILDNVMFQISEACSAIEELEIPTLSKEEIHVTVEAISRNITALATLLLRVNTNKRRRHHDDPE